MPRLSFLPPLSTRDVLTEKATEAFNRVLEVLARFARSAPETGRCLRKTYDTVSVKTALPLLAERSRSETDRLHGTIDEEHLEESVKGVRFVVNEAGRITDVIISLKTNPGLLDDIYDQSLARKRSADPRESLASVKRKLADRGARRRI